MALTKKPNQVLDYRSYRYNYCMQTITFKLWLSLMICHFNATRMSKNQQQKSYVGLEILIQRLRFFFLPSRALSSCFVQYNSMESIPHYHPSKKQIHRRSLTNLLGMRNKKRPQSVLLLRQYIWSNFKVASQSPHQQVHISYHIHSFVAQVNWCMRFFKIVLCRLFYNESLSHRLTKGTFLYKKALKKNVHAQHCLGIYVKNTAYVIPLK